MKNYEIMLLFSSAMSDQDIQKSILEFKDEITKTEGKIISEDLWGRRDLAYQVGKETEGYYAVILFEYNPALLKELDHSLKLNKAVLRFLITVPYNVEKIEKYAEYIEQEREQRKLKKAERIKKEQEKDKEIQEKLKIKTERKEKKMLREIEEEISKEKVVDEPTVDEKFDEKLSKIIDADLDL